MVICFEVYFYDAVILSITSTTDEGTDNWRKILVLLETASLNLRAQLQFGSAASHIMIMYHQRMTKHHF